MFIESQTDDEALWSKTLFQIQKQTVVRYLAVILRFETDP